MSAPPLSAVVVSYNTREALLECLHSLAREAPGAQVIVVDNASTDGSAEAARAAFPSAMVVANNENVGFARANNQALRLATAARVLLLNSDAVLRPDAVDALHSALDGDPRIAIAGPRTLNEDGTVQVSFGPDLTLVSEWRQRRLVRGVARRDPRALATATSLAATPAEPDWISASCLLARRDALLAVEGFDEGFFLYEEDADLCLRLRAAGWRVVFEPRATVVHQGGGSMAALGPRARLEYDHSHLRYYAKHRGPIETAVLRALIGARALAGRLRGR